jgi:replicative superfamily II helicase
MRGIGTQAPLAPGQVQQAAAEAVQQQAKAQAVGRQQEAELAVGVEQTRLGAQALAQRETLQQRKLALGNSLRTAENRLTALGMTTKQELFDSTMRFEQDELGRTMFNERQLLDYAITHARKIEDFQNYEQTISQMSERRMRLMQVAQSRLEQALKQSFTEEQTELSQEAKLGLARAKAALEEKIKREKANAQNRASMWSAIGGTAAAAIAIAIPGGAPFAGAAYAVGSGLGGLASQTE